MTAATAYCTSNTSFHQHSLTSPRSQFTSVPRRTTLSPSTSLSSTTLISHIEQPSIIKTIKSDENNNEHQFENLTIANSDEILYITSDYDDDDDDDDDDVEDNGPTLVDINEEQFLSFVGLRCKTKKRIMPNLTLQPLTKRLAFPICLLPLPKNRERVRQALNIRLPSLKSLSITYDIENYCSTDENAKAQSLLPRSTAQKRALSTLHKSKRKHKLPKAEFISMAANTYRNHRSKTSVGKYVNSILQCHVILDRLDQSAIDQIMQNSTEDDHKCTAILSASDQSLGTTSPKTCPSLSIATTDETTTTTTTRTTITTMTTEKTIIKRKSTTDAVKPKRFKSANNDCTVVNNNDARNDLSSLTYERICLKCFVCSKREYVAAQTIDSDALHSHWLEHDGDLSLNIYDSEIDSILTRVVEFFNSPKQHMLEGKIKTVFILDSKEIRCTSTTNLPSNDCIVID